MTCKDCVNRRHCNSLLKSYWYGEDGDSWANWCDEFMSRHKPISVEKDGYTAYQSGSDYHISITEKLTGQMVFHASCTKRVSKRALRRMIDQYSAEVFKRAFLELYHNGDLEL